MRFFRIDTRSKILQMAGGMRSMAQGVRVVFDSRRHFSQSHRQRTKHESTNASRTADVQVPCWSSK